MFFEEQLDYNMQDKTRQMIFLEAYHDYLK